MPPLRVLLGTGLVAVCLMALAPGSASAAVSAWKLVSVRGETTLHVEDSRSDVPCEDKTEPWVATGDYRTVLTSKRAIFGRGYGAYTGLFGTIVGTFQVDFKVHREATERVTFARIVSDPVTEEDTCTIEERACSGSSEKRSKGRSGLGFGPQRRRGRLGPVRVGFSGHWSFHSCDRRARDPLLDLEVERGHPASGRRPSVEKVLPLSRFHPRRMRVVMEGSAPMHSPHDSRTLEATLRWRFVWRLRRTVVGSEGCVEEGRPSGFVCSLSP